MIQSKSRSRLDGLQYLRGICATLVVISHCNGILGKPEYYGRTAFGDLHLPSVFAVAVFFTISGFIIIVSSLNDDLSPRLERGEYMRRRVVRIVPFLWLCTIGYNALSWAGAGVLDGEAILRTLTLWPAGEPKPNVVWSLRNEMLFYIAFALIMLGARRHLLALPVILVASAAFYLLAFDLGFGTPYAATAWFDALKTLMGSDFGANFQFAAGIAIGVTYLRRGRWIFATPLSPVWMLVLMLAATVAILLAPMESGLAVCLIWTAMAMPILAASVWARPACGWAGKLGLILGNASFAIYLVHNAAILILIALARAAHLAMDSQAERLAFVAGSVALATAGGIAVHYLVEVPVIRFFERLSRPVRQPPARILVDDADRREG